MSSLINTTDPQPYVFRESERREIPDLARGYEDFYIFSPRRRYHRARFYIVQLASEDSDIEAKYAIYDRVRKCCAPFGSKGAVNYACESMNSYPWEAEGYVWFKEV